MTPVALARQMIAAGMDVETALAAAESFEASAKADHDALIKNLLDRLGIDPKADARRAKDRARKAGIPRNSAESVEFRGTKDVSPTPPSENNPIPPLTGGTFPEIGKASPPEKPKPPKPKPLSAWVSEIWEITPRIGRERSGKASLENALRAAGRRGFDLASVKRGVAGYYACHDATKDQGQYAQGVHVAVSSGRWEAFAEAEPNAPPAEEDPWPRRLLNWRVNAYWNSEWGPKPGKPGYQGPSAEIAA